MDSPLEVPGQLDTLWVSITASRTAEGDLCRPSTRLFALDRREVFPLLIHVEAGEEFSYWAAFRLSGRRGDQEMIFRELTADLPVEGFRDVAVELEPLCYDRACEAGEQCLHGECVVLPRPGLFDGSSWSEESPPCDRAAELDGDDR